MAWVDKAGNSPINGINLLDAVATNVFTLKNGASIPNNQRCFMCNEIDLLVNVEAVAGDNKLVLKNQLIAVNNTITLQSVILTSVPSNVTQPSTGSYDITLQLNTPSSFRDYDWHAPTTVTNNGVIVSSDITILENEKLTQVLSFYDSNISILGRTVRVYVNGTQAATSTVNNLNSSLMTLSPARVLTAGDIIKVTLE